MKKRNPLHRMINQFAYEHKALDNLISRIRRSAGELSRLLGDLEEKNKKVEKK